jgi:hypothetical protein
MTKPSQLTRREMIASGIAYLALQSVNSVGTYGQGTRHLLDRIQAVSSTHPAYPSLLDQHFSSYRTSPAFNALQNHTCLFLNKTDQPIRALAIEWSIPMEDGSQRRITSHYFIRSKGALNASETPRGQGRLLSGRRTIVRPGETFMATPLFVISESTNTRHLKENLRQRPLGKSHLENNEELYTASIMRNRRLSKVLVEGTAGGSSTALLRAVIFAKELVDFTGDLRTARQLQKRFFRTRHAELDEAKSVLELIGQGMSVEQVNEQLVKHKTKLKPNLIPSGKHFYWKARKEYAHKLQRHLKRHGVEPTTLLLTKILERPRLHPRDAA